MSFKVHVSRKQIFILATTILFAASNIVRDVLLNLVNFLAYFEAEETHKEEIEEEVQRIKHQVINNEKRLNEEERYLNKCRQV